MTDPLLQLDHVRVRYRTRRMSFKGAVVYTDAVRDVSLELGEGQTLALVGESGSGKSTTARVAVALERPTSGRVLFDGNDLALIGRAQLRDLRSQFQIVFQDPHSSLDSRMQVLDLIAEPLVIHKWGNTGSREARVHQLLDEVGLPRATTGRQPHQLSGGQRQRVAIARALALNPRLIVADEPVSALDVSVRAQILNLLSDLQKQHNLSYLMVSHDLALVNHTAQFVAVMFRGSIVESGPCDQVITSPAHPYTRALVEAVPSPDPAMVSPAGTVREWPEHASGLGCQYANRCPQARGTCFDTAPPVVELQLGRSVACHFPLVAGTTTAPTTSTPNTGA
ncbi:MAG: ATP-binding cassette domain-containing protein [Actinobacteria bacterium]|nr:ATP-binding cassette domain-containing protein [Actinomycetota bacterium]